MLQMSTKQLHDLARKHRGEPVKIVDQHRDEYFGVIKKVTSEGIYLSSNGSGIFFPFFTIASLFLLIPFLLFF
ncbi:hypothetical protein SAMN05428981_1011232 [Bacillus sp. OV194]|nr:hypothetical protein SAMN05428981_1011232 [Bacillus sp. OV194]